MTPASGPRRFTTLSAAVRDGCARYPLPRLDSHDPAGGRFGRSALHAAWVAEFEKDHPDGYLTADQIAGAQVWWYAKWKAACEAIGLPALRPYDLRRSAVRNLIHSGVPELTAMKISGHKTRETFRRYAIEDPSDIAAAIETVAAYVTAKMKSGGTVVRFPTHAQTRPIRPK